MKVQKIRTTRSPFHGMYNASILVSSLLVVVLAAGCSEDDKVEPPDTTAPQTRILYPPLRIDDNWVVSDSTYVYAVAQDDRSVENVEFYFRRPGQSEFEQIARTSTTFPESQVPDSLSEFVEVPAGWSLYRARWVTGAIGSGSRPILFTRATDPAGNVGVSEQTPVFILNLGEEIGPPTVNFAINPPNVVQNATVTFDPTGLTFDRIDLPDAIQVRWDFEGDADPEDPEDSRWDTDWVPGTQIQTHEYPRLGQFRPRAIGRNTYFVGFGLSPDTYRVRVIDVDGAPRPPNANDYVDLVPASQLPRSFTIGLADTMQYYLGLADRDEYPAFQNRINNAVKIQKYETTNALYLTYLNTALTEQKAKFIGGGIYYRNDAVPDSTVLYLELINSRIFFDLDDNRFEIEVGYENHPVTGVTYYGAEAYCSAYGLRLPKEAEWEIAARGDSLNWVYPWGRSQFDGDATGRARCNFANSTDPYEPGTTPVGFYDGRLESGFQTVATVSPRGLVDVAGNVAEWTGDWYDIYPTGTQQEYGGPNEGVFKVIRGGSFLSTGAKGVRCTARSAGAPLDASYPSVGFRPAYDVFE